MGDHLSRQSVMPSSGCRPLRARRDWANLIRFNAAIIKKGDFDTPAGSNHLRDRALVHAKSSNKHGLGAVLF
jgi:hypothetical protein